MCIKGSWPGAFLPFSRGRKAWDQVEHGSDGERDSLSADKILRDKCRDRGGEWLSERPELSRRGCVVQGKESDWHSGEGAACADVRGEGGDSVQACGVLNHGGLWTP